MSTTFLSRAAFAAALLATLAGASTGRSEDTADAFALLRRTYEQQTTEELPAASRTLSKAWQACEAKGLTHGGDDAPRGAIVFYEASYGGRGRLAVSNGDGTVLVDGKESISIDAIPGLLGWIEGPKETPKTAATSATATVSTFATAAKTSAADPLHTTTSKTPSSSIPAVMTPATTASGKPASDGLESGPTTAATKGTGTAPTTTKPAEPAKTSPAQPQPVANNLPNNTNAGNNAPVANAPQNTGNGGQPQGMPLQNNGSGFQPQQNNGSNFAPQQSGPSGSGGQGSSQPSLPSPVAKDPNFTPTSGSSFTAKGTGYYPANNAMEGGFKDRKGKPLSTLQDFLANKSPFVSVAMDANAFPYGTKLRIKELEAKYGRQIDFRVVDTGGAFRGKGTTRIDICTGSSRDSHDATINGTLHCEVVK